MEREKRARINAYSRIRQRRSAQRQNVAVDEGPPAMATGDQILMEAVVPAGDLNAAEREEVQNITAPARSPSPILPFQSHPTTDGPRSPNPPET